MDFCSHSHPTLMAPDAAKNVVEAARASALAAHCAAGLASSAGLREAARLLRTAEALSRSAIAALTCPSPLLPAKAAGSAGMPAVPSARARRRRNKKQKEEMNMSAKPMDVAQSLAAADGVSKVAAVAPPSVLSADATVFEPGKTRILKPRTSRERSPRRCSSQPTASSTSALVGAASGSASAGLFAVGQTVMLGGLESRPELTGSVSILSYDSVVGRYAVTVDATGEKIKVKEVNLHAPS